MAKLPTISRVGVAQGRPGRDGFFVTRPARLLLADKTIFSGASPDWQRSPSSGEVVFNTGMTGYVESLTDPSYADQILVFTYPLIGNYGISAEDTWESHKIHAAGVVVSQACRNWSHSGSDRSLLEWLKQQNVPIITEVDTRALTKHLRTRGTMMGTLTSQRTTSSVPSKLPVPRISIPEPVAHNPRRRTKVILVDCGAKRNILRSLLKLPVSVKQVPYNYDYTNEPYDGVVISNGPGDPTDYPETIAIATKALKANKPVFGICLGTQIMGLAAGATTYKLAFGHRGHNQPCIDAAGDRCYITSQNHGYALNESSLPRGWRVSFRNLNDNSVEGIEHASKPFFSVQFHPEASPGPTDTAWLFEKFYRSL